MDTVKVRKKNKIKVVNQNRVDAHLKQGYDQVDDNNKIVKRATGGKSVSLAEHNKVLDELAVLKKTPASELQEQLEALKKENATLKGKITKLEKAEKTDNKEVS